MKKFWVKLSIEKKIYCSWISLNNLRHYQEKKYIKYFLQNTFLRLKTYHFLNCQVAQNNHFFGMMYITFYAQIEVGL